MSSKIGRKPKRGLSEAVAIIILLGIALTFSIVFLTFMQTDYSARQSTAIVQRIVELEKMNTIIRLIDTTGDVSVFLFRKLDNYNVIHFFVYNGSGYANCQNVVKNVVGGKIVDVKNHSVNDLMVLFKNDLYSFKYYAKSQGYLDTGYVNICTIELEGNTIVSLSTPSNGVDKISVLIVTYINNIPYVVDIYSYRFR
ncbi:MAG: hypothetical protein QW775_02165 [Ignisphaera sp.]|uniref:Uncharacterized protein n=1 Tax=Ignisphaera aggregans TaxID=334771 RepID=A0A7C4NMC7_9CREN